MVDRVGYTATLQPATPTPDAWIDLVTTSTNNYGEYGSIGRTHTGIGVWAYLKVPSSATNTKCVLRNATTGAYIDVSPVVNVSSTTGAWYFYALTGTYSQQDVSFFIYSDNDNALSYARTTNIGNNLKKHTYASNEVYDSPTFGISNYTDNNHDMFSYYEYESEGNSGTLSVTLDDFTSTASGSLSDFAGSVNVTLADFTPTASGTVTNPPITGTVGVTLGDFTSTASGTAGTNVAQVNIAPKSNWDYVAVTVLSTAGDLIPSSPALSVSDQVYGETLGGAVTYKKDGTVNLTTSPSDVLIEVHDSSVWSKIQPLAVTQSQRSISITLADVNQNILPSISNIEWAWYDQVGASTLTTTTEKGLTETTDGSGILDILLGSSALSFGDTGTLLIEADIDFGQGVVKASGLYRVVLG